MQMENSCGGMIACELHGEVRVLWLTENDASSQFQNHRRIGPGGARGRDSRPGRVVGPAS